MSSLAHTADHGSTADPFAPLRDAGLEAIVLLAGTVRQTDFRRAIGCHILQLPVAAECTLLTRWVSQVAGLAQRLGAEPIEVRVVLSAEDAVPDVRHADARSRLSFGTDPQPTRGTAGVLRDLAEGLPEDRWLLVANANQLFTGELHLAVERLAAAAGELTLMPAHDGNGGFLMLTRCRCLSGVSPRGFIDLKEQALPAIAQRFDVRVVPPEERLTPTSIRSRRDYLALLRRAALQGAPDHEPWACRFAIVAPDAGVAPDALIHDSVILPGGSVGAGAVVARSVVCAGARIEPGQVVRDTALSPAASFPES